MLTDSETTIVLNMLTYAEITILMIMGAILLAAIVNVVLNNYFYPCRRGCRHGNDVGMPEYSCTKRCQYTNRKIK